MTTLFHTLHVLYFDVIFNILKNMFLNHLSQSLIQYFTVYVAFQLDLLLHMCSSDN